MCESIAERVERALRPKARPRRVNTPVRAPWATKVVVSMLPARISTNAPAWIAERVERARGRRRDRGGSIHSRAVGYEGGGINAACTDIDECVGVLTNVLAEGETEAGQYTRIGLRGWWYQHGPECADVDCGS